jgi:hypothetical protein
MDSHDAEPAEPQPCPGFPVPGIPADWDAVDVLLEHAVRCPEPSCRRWMKRWRLDGGWMSHGDPGE